uniref:Pepsin-I3 domain-containing protein n=1 Tax=Syphacia muris TaxID=451379 RepID=A0A0N5AGV0_9BILA
MLLSTTLTLIVLVGPPCLLTTCNAYFVSNSAIRVSSSSSKALEIISNTHPFRKCIVIGNNRLFYNDHFVRFLNPYEVREVENYKRKLTLWNIGFQEHINRKLQTDLKPIEDIERELNSFTHRMDDFNKRFGIGGFINPAAFWKRMPALQSPFTTNYQRTTDFHHSQNRQLLEIPEFPRAPSFCDA